MGASCDRAALRLRVSLLSVGYLVVPIKIVVLLPSCFHLILDSASSSGAVLIVTWRTGLVERSAKVVAQDLRSSSCLRQRKAGAESTEGAREHISYRQADVCGKHVARKVLDARTVARAEKRRCWCEAAPHMSSASADDPGKQFKKKEQMIQLLDPSDAEDQEMFSALSDRSEKLFAAKRQVKTLNRSVSVSMVPNRLENARWCDRRERSGDHVLYLLNLRALWMGTIEVFCGTCLLHCASCNWFGNRVA